MKAELIEGVVYVASPVSDEHGGPHLKLAAWLAAYADEHQDVVGYDNVTLYLSPASMPQPDLMLRYKVGGSSRTEQGYIEGRPELVIEVAASSASLDLHAKLRMYQRAGVPEYLVWRTLDEEVDWFVLEGTEYVRLEPTDGGVIESRQFPGLRLSPALLINGRLKDLLALLR